jgi:glycosyltransferase involved in cell wall biosynthesis
MADELEGHGVQRLSLWPKAVDTKEFHPQFASLQMRNWLSDGHPDDPLFLYVGRLSPEKGIATLRSVLEIVPSARLAIVGGGPSEKSLKAHFVDTRTFLAGYLTGRRLAEAMASVSALVLPSQTEPLGMVLMEAMAAGSIVIGANAGGIPDVVQHEVNGLLFNPNLDGDLARMAHRIIAEPVICEMLRANARRQSEEWSWAASTRQLLRFYEAAIQTPRFDKPERAKAPWMLVLKRAAIGGIKIFLS